MNFAVASFLRFGVLVKEIARRKPTLELSISEPVLNALFLYEDLPLFIESMMEVRRRTFANRLYPIQYSFSLRSLKRVWMDLPHKGPYRRDLKISVMTKI